MTKSIIQQQAKAELRRRRDASAGQFALLDRFLSAKQREFIHHPSKRKVARCGRRAGKTTGFSVYMVMECLKTPKFPALFLGITRDSAMRNVWDPLIAVLDAIGVSYEARISSGTIRFDNGSHILVFGGDTPRASDRLRGTAWGLIGIDESGFQVDYNFDRLVESLIPSLADYDGTLCFLSSPGYVPEGLFWSCDVGPHSEKGYGNLKWAQFHWTLLDNPHFQKAPTRTRRDGTTYPSYGHQFLDEVLHNQYGGDENHPAYRREWLGLWVFDDTNLIYPFSAQNYIPRLVEYPDQHHGIGMDLGSSSATAITVVRYSPYERDVQIVHAYKQSGLLVDDMARLLQDAIVRYNVDLVVADTGGLGKVPVEEFRRRYGIPVSAAEKTEKAFFQRVVANDLHAGYIKAPADCPIFSEWSKIVKDPKTGEELKGQENHLADAFLYIYRRIYSTHLKYFETPLTEEDRIREQFEQRLQRQVSEFTPDFTEGWD